MLLRRESNQTVIMLSESMLIGVGGEARVYSLAQTPSLVAKVYHEPTELKARKLAAMLANPPLDPMKNSGHTSIAWPVDLLLPLDAVHKSAQAVAGFLMPRINRMKPVIDFYHPRTRRQNCPLFNYLYLHRAGRNLAAAVRSLHERGYVVGDMNESNILVSETALVTLVDTDSFQVRDPQTSQIYRCAVGKPEFTPPELQGKYFAELDREPSQDLFGLAVILFQLLMEGTHPFAGLFTGRGEPPPVETRISSGHFPHGLSGLSGLTRRVPYRPMPAAPPFEVLSPRLQELFIRCFDEGHSNPQLRPDAQTWAEALKEAEDALLVCSANNQHRYGTHLPECPWCERAKQLAGRDPFPSKQAVQQRQHLAPAPKKPKPKPRPVATQPYIVMHPPPVTTYIPPPPTRNMVSTVTSMLKGIGRSAFPFIWVLFVILRAVSSSCDDGPSKVSRPRIQSSLPASLVATFSGHTDSVQSVSFSPDGSLIASASRDKTIKLWKISGHELIRTLSGHEFTITAVAFAPETIPGGYDLASGSTDKSLAFWKVDSTQMRKMSPLHGSTVTAIAYSRDGRLLATGTADAMLRLWDVASGRVLREFTGDENGVTAVAFSEDGRKLASGSFDGIIKLRDVVTGKLERTIQIEASVNTPTQIGGWPPISALAFSPDLSLVAVGAYDKTLRLWDLSTGTQTRELYRGQDAALSLVFSRLGKVLASGHADGRIMLWNVNQGTKLRDFSANIEAINSIAISPGGNYLVSGDSDNEVRVWKTNEIGSLDVPNPGATIAPPPPPPPPRPRQ